MQDDNITRSASEVELSSLACKQPDSYRILAARCRRKDTDSTCSSPASIKGTERSGGTTLIFWRPVHRQRMLSHGYRTLGHGSGPHNLFVPQIEHSADVAPAH